MVWAIAIVNYISICLVILFISHRSMNAWGGTLVQPSEGSFFIKSMFPKRRDYLPFSGKKPQHPLKSKLCSQGKDIKLILIGILFLIDWFCWFSYCSTLGRLQKQWPKRFLSLRYLWFGFLVALKNM